MSDNVVNSAGTVVLARKLGLTEVIAIVIGRIIGSGIFRTPALIYLAVGCTSLFYGVWILGGIVSLMGAFCIMEMSAMMPASGGPYAFLRACYPPAWAFLRGWAMFFVVETGAIVAVALVFAEYSASLLETLCGISTGVPTIAILSLIVIWGFTIANCFGVALSGKIQTVVSSAKVFALIVVIIAGLSLRPNVAHLSMNFWPDVWDLNLFLLFFGALRYGLFAYSGWEGATYVAEEVKNPGRNLPLSLLLGLTSVLFLYLATNTSYLLQLAPEQFASSKSVAADSMKVAMGAAGGILIAVAIAMSTSGNVGTQIMVKARTWYAMSRDGLFFQSMSRLHPIYKTPNHALILQGAWATVLLTMALLSKTFGFEIRQKNAYESIIDFFSFTSAFFNVLTLFCVFILRKKSPELPRPFKVPLYPVPVVIAIIVYSIVMIAAMWRDPIPSVLGALMTASGLLYYYRLKNIT